MKKIILLLLISISILPVTLSGQQTAIEEAETAYREQDFTKAIRIYEEILSIYGESAEIYYNLGNACYRANQTGPAILNYERALLLNPGDPDIRFNLQLARQRAVDHIQPAGTFFLARWFRSIENMGKADSWGKLAIGAFLLFLGCLTLFFFSRWVRLKKIGFYTGLVLLFIIIFANVFAYNQKDELVNRKTAIVFSPTVTVKGSPDNTGTDLFLLHEGTKVFIQETAGNWYEVELEDGKKGWMQSKDIVII
ncbi:MAG: tetratricopeptide repeat protein [Tannerellaceae bacterium]|nr:tetratricopeptide repeat protein [Tannerellaceae bacterium]